MIGLGIVGCGDVAFRSYFPGLKQLREGRVVACFDAARDRAERAAALFPGARAVSRLEDLLAHEGVDAVANLTPAPAHAELTALALEADRHVYSEKPLALTLQEADELIALAERRGKLLLCAPAMMATARFRWLRRLVADGAIGRPILGSAHFTSVGPAAWRDYTGDPRPFFRADVGPVLDLGVYVIHGFTGLLGPATRIQAFASVGMRERPVEIEGRPRETIDVAGDDQVLLHLDFGGGVLAQVLTAFTVPQVRQRPAFELYGTTGTMTVSTQAFYDDSGPTEFTNADGRRRERHPPERTPYHQIIAVGLPHLVACLEGRDQPVLTAEHARHVLEISLAARRSAAEGRAIELETTF